MGFRLQPHSAQPHSTADGSKGYEFCWFQKPNRPRNSSLPASASSSYIVLAPPLPHSPPQWALIFPSTSNGKKNGEKSRPGRGRERCVKLQTAAELRSGAGLRARLRRTLCPCPCALLVRDVGVFLCVEFVPGSLCLPLHLESVRVYSYACAPLSFHLPRLCAEACLPQQLCKQQPTPIFTTSFTPWNATRIRVHLGIFCLPMRFAGATIAQYSPLRPAA